MLDQIPVMQKRHVIRKSAGLPHVMCDKDYFCLLSAGGQHDLLDHLHGCRVETGSCFIKQKNFRPCRKRPRQSQPLLLAAGQQPGRLLGLGFKANARQQFVTPRPAFRLAAGAMP